MVDKIKLEPAVFQTDINEEGIKTLFLNALHFRHNKTFFATQQVTSPKGYSQLSNIMLK